MVSFPKFSAILHLYGLAKYLRSWLKDGSFPDKPAWKKIFRSRNSVSSQHKLQRQDPLSCHTDFSSFRTILGSTEPSSIWKLPRNCYEINLCKFICKLTPSIRDFNENQVCLLCQKLFTNVFAYASCACLATANIRDLWWIDIVNLFDIRLSAELYALTKDHLFYIVENIAALYNRATLLI